MAIVIKRCVWLVDLLRDRRLTLEEINRRWQVSSINYDHKALTRTTFNRHREEIFSLLGVDIEYDRSGKVYYIADEDNQLDNTTLGWLIDSFSVLNHIDTAVELKGKVIYENIPSGNKWLGQIIDAIKNCERLAIEYANFITKQVRKMQIEPLCVRVCRRRWYVISYLYQGGDKEKTIWVHALDRIQSLTPTGKNYQYPSNFDPEKHFANFVGLYTDDTTPLTHIRIKASGVACDYITSLPIHHTQKQESTDGESVIFTYDLCPSHEFYQQIIRYGGDVEVLEPESIRNEIKKIAYGIISRYEK